MLRERSLSYSSNQLTAVNTTERQFSYNAQGARTLDDRSGSANDYEFEYDPFSNLTQVKKGGAATSPGLFMTGRSARHPELVEGPPVNSPSYTADYDAFGRRFRWSDGTNTSYFLYDGAVPFAEFGSTGTLQRRIFWGQTGPICLRQSGNRWFIADKFGNTRALVDDNGSITDYYAYDAWGGPVSGKSSGSSYNPFRWNGSSGYQYVNQTTLYHVGAREYDPTVGRWLQRDPIAMSGGWPNLYGYCANDPVTGVDPSGLRVAEIGPNRFQVVAWIHELREHEKHAMPQFDQPTFGGFVGDLGRAGVTDAVLDFAGEAGSAAGWALGGVEAIQQINEYGFGYNEKFKDWKRRSRDGDQGISNGADPRPRQGMPGGLPSWSEDPLRPEKQRPTR